MFIKYMIFNRAAIIDNISINENSKELKVISFKFFGASAGDC